MALQKSYSKFGATFGSAYHRVQYVSLFPKESSPLAHIVMCVWADAAAKDNGDPPFDQFTVVCSTDYNNYFLDTVLDTVDYNPQERAYEFLKALVTTPVDYTTGTTDV